VFLEELSRKRNEIVRKVLDRDKQIILEAIEKVTEYFKEHEGELCHSKIVCPEMIMAEEKRPLVKQKIPLVLAAMCREEIIELDKEKTLECGIPHYRFK
jgi:hypothetical protein